MITSTCVLPVEEDRSIASSGLNVPKPAVAKTPPGPWKAAFAPPESVEEMRRRWQRRQEADVELMMRMGKRVTLSWFCGGPLDGLAAVKRDSDARATAIVETLLEDNELWCAVYRRAEGQEWKFKRWSPAQRPVAARSRGQQGQGDGASQDPVRRMRDRWIAKQQDRWDELRAAGRVPAVTSLRRGPMAGLLQVGDDRPVLGSALAFRIENKLGEFDAVYRCSGAFWEFEGVQPCSEFAKLRMPELGRRTGFQTRRG